LTFQNESQILELIAERPFERSLRLIFADWLLEQGDPRGEVISASIHENLPLSTKRRINRLVAEHQSSWTGELSQVIDATRSVWTDGFLDDVTLLPSCTAKAIEAVAADPRWATLRTVRFPMRLSHEAGSTLLALARLPSLQELTAPANLLPALAVPRQTRFAVKSLGLCSWGTFEDELQLVDLLLGRASGFGFPSTLKLYTSEFMNGASANEVRFNAQRQLNFNRFEHLQLCVQYGAIEGVARWLLLGDLKATLAHHSPQLERWSVSYSECVFSLSHHPHGAFATFTADLRGKESAIGLGQRIAATASVLVQLAPAQLRQVDLQLPHAARLKHEERDSLRASLRRLGSIEKLTLDGEVQTP
jgi:uncharacterized protein (TIGR02996 family)